jgi:hypothetical protein
MALALGAVLTGALARRREQRRRPSLRVSPSGTLLVAALAAATPVGLILYSLYDTSLYAPRNLLASLPALCLLLGAAVAAVRFPFRAVAATCLIAGVALASVHGLDSDHRRPPYNEVGDFLDREAGTRDAVLLLLPGGDTFGRNLVRGTPPSSRIPALHSLELGLHRRHPLLVAAAAVDKQGFGRVLARAAELRRLFVVVAPVAGVPLSILRERLGPPFHLVFSQVYPAYAPIRVAVYQPRR